MSASPRTSRVWRASFARSSRRDRRRDDVMTREATSQGRRGGIFLAMFAVVALRSTTVLATMESVSGDTAVDHGGDVARIRGRKLLALLPERYEAHPEFSCAGRNELGYLLTLSLAECAAKCEEYPTCISFDFKTPTADWTSTSAYSCNLSETCTKELAATDLAYTLFVKLPRCVEVAPSHWNFIAGTEFRVSTATTPDYIHFTPGGCWQVTNEGYVEGNVSTTPGVTYVVKVELGVVYIPPELGVVSNSPSLKTTVGQASQTFNASALVPRSDRSLYEWVEAATFTAAANSLSTTLRFEEGDYNCMDMKDVELCPVCDASAPIANGDVGNCTSVLVYGESCTPTCDTGYLLMGGRSCVSGTTVDTAACVTAPPPPSPPPPSPPPPPAPLPPALRLHLVADDINTTSHADMVWRDKSSFGNDLKPHLAAPEVIEDAFNGHKALRFGFSDFFQDGVEGFSCMRLDPLSSDNLLTYGSMSHWSFPGVTVFAVIEPRPVPWGGDDDPLDFVFDFGEFPARGFGLAWHENERTLYSPTEHGGEVRRSAESRENKKYVVAIQYTFGQDGHVRALTQFTTRLGRADLIDTTEINGAAQGFSVQGFTPATVAHEQSPFSVGCMSKENTAGGAKGKRVFRGDIAELRLYVGLLPLDEVFAIRDGLVEKYVPECDQGCSLLTRRGLSQVDRYDEPAATAPTPEAYKCVADGECVSARYIRIYKTESAADKTINLLELAAWSSSFPDVNLAAGKDVTCSPACRHYGGGALLVDGSTNTDVAHSCYEGTSGTRGDLAEGACASTVPKSMEIDLGQEYLIDGVLIVNRLNAYRTRVEDMKVDFKDADGNVVLTTAAIASDKNGYDGYVMDLTKEGDSLNDAGEFDAWKYIPEGDVVEAANFDWRPYRR